MATRTAEPEQLAQRAGLVAASKRAAQLQLPHQRASDRVKVMGHRAGPQPEAVIAELAPADQPVRELCWRSREHECVETMGSTIGSIKTIPAPRSDQGRVKPPADLIDAAVRTISTTALQPMGVFDRDEVEQPILRLTDQFEPVAPVNKSAGRAPGSRQPAGCQPVPSSARRAAIVGL